MRSGADLIRVEPVAGKPDLKAFIDLPFRLYADDPHWVPPLKSEVRELLDPRRNPFFEHAEVQLFLARRGARVVGRISAHVDRLALAQPPEQGMGPGTGNWGMMEAEDADAMRALIARAEEWLRTAGMSRVLAPLSLSVWDEPGLLVKGADHSPMVMMGHHDPRYRGWIEAEGYAPVKTLLTYELEVQDGLPPLIARIVASGEKNPRIRLRQVDLKRFDEEAATILRILNDAWSGNWGFVPITDSEVAYVGKKLRPLVHEDLIMIAELDGEPVAFMMTLPDANAPIKAIRGRLFPLGWARLLWWLRRPTDASMRVPLMGVAKRLQSSRLASQLAFMLIETIRRVAVSKYGTRRTEIGWVLDDNHGMNAIAKAINSDVNREYRLYAKPL
jgi:GNAT superfamily N-acetyltransferase